MSTHSIRTASKKEAVDLVNSVFRSKLTLQDVLQELKELKESMKDIITTLTTEVIMLRKEVRDLKQGNVSALFNADDPDENLLPDFPLTTMEELMQFEVDLQNDNEMVEQLKRVILRQGGDDLANFIRSSIRKIISDTLATNYTWKGTASKPAIETFLFVSIIRGVCHQRFCNAEDSTISSIFQKNFLHAADRVKKREKKQEWTNAFNQNT